MGCADGCDEFGEEGEGGRFSANDDLGVDLFEGSDAAVRVDEELVKRLVVMVRVVMHHLMFVNKLCFPRFMPFEL